MMSLTASSSMIQMLLTQKTHDGVELKVHKQILSKESVVFEKMFTIDMVEADNNVVKIIDFSGKVMKE